MNVLLVRCAGLGMVDDISEYLNMVIFVLPFVREDPHRKRTVQIALPKQKTMHYHEIRNSVPALCQNGQLRQKLI